MDLIVDRSNAQEPVELHYPGDDLFAPCRRRRGLPIGNLTSQFFANLYLDCFDHFVTEVLRAPYVRYVDDFVLFDDKPAVLSEWRRRICQFLEGRRLKLHPNKTRIMPNVRAGPFPRLHAAPRWPSPAARGQRAAFPKSTAWASRPVARRHDRPRRRRGQDRRLDRPCAACTYVALAPCDLRGRLVRATPLEA
jgi:Reverse transcriptase (RNA-dependent DNA polymerase)